MLKASAGSQRPAEEPASSLGNQVGNHYRADQPGKLRPSIPAMGLLMDFFAFDLAFFAAYAYRRRKMT
jgi:hypothetical protein